MARHPICVHQQLSEIWTQLATDLPLGSSSHTEMVPQVYEIFRRSKFSKEINFRGFRGKRTKYHYHGSEVPPPAAQAETLCPAEGTEETCGPTDPEQSASRTIPPPTTTPLSLTVPQTLGHPVPPQGHELPEKGTPTGDQGCGPQNPAGTWASTEPMSRLLRTRLLK